MESTRKFIRLLLDMANKIATKKNIEKLKAALLKHDIKPSYTTPERDSRSAQTIADVRVCKKRT
jgi:hypothetical protein